LVVKVRSAFRRQEGEMASYRGHLMFSTALGAGYGGLALWQGAVTPMGAALGAGLTAISGLLPDLDSDSGMPLRIMFNLAALLSPVLLLHQVLDLQLPLIQTGLVLLGIALLVRYPVAHLFKRFTVHRGMFHSVPGMLIAGLVVFLAFHRADIALRLFIAGGTMIGFLSHLVLDELCSVDFTGTHIKLNKAAGSAVKLSSSSWLATGATYLVLGVLLWKALPDLESPRAREVGEGWRVAGTNLLERVGLRRYLH
jgi:hypothetical protein